MSDQGPNAPRTRGRATQMPAAAAAWEPPIDSGSQVVVVVSRGVSPTPAGAPAAVPELLGVSQGDALSKLQEVGLTAQVFNDYSATVARGKVIGQLPESGLAAPQGMSVILIVSNGKLQPGAAGGLPDVVGLSESEAVAKLQAAGLVPQVVREYSPKVPEGVVMATLPNAHSLAAAPKRSLLWLWIVLGVVALLLLGGLWYANRTRTESPLVVLGVVATRRPRRQLDRTDCSRRTDDREGPRRRRDVSEGRRGGPGGRGLRPARDQGDHQRHAGG